MADDLVVREFAEIAKEWTRDKAPYNWGDYAETGALARAYLALVAERDAWRKAQGQSDRFADQWCEKARAAEAQLAAMTAERDAARGGPTQEAYEIQSDAIAGLRDKFAASEAARGRLQKLVNEQAEDDGLWFVAQFASEAYLQQELRTLHAAIEALAEPKEGES